MRGLTHKQERFVQEYLVDLNATQAAIRAGYSARTAEWIGPQLLGKSHVSNAIAMKMADRSKRTEITADLVMRDVEAIKRDAMRESADKDGNPAMVNHAAALKACELQGKHLGMFTDKLAMTIESSSDEELDAKIVDLLRKTGIGKTAG